MFGILFFNGDRPDMFLKMEHNMVACTAEIVFNTITEDGWM
jgi:hypothetical protein